MLFYTKFTFMFTKDYVQYMTFLCPHFYMIMSKAKKQPKMNKYIPFLCI